MEITVTASFDEAETAAMAASALAMVQSGTLGMLVTTESLVGGAPSAMATLGRPKQAGRFGNHLVRVKCRPDLESYAVGELAALGAAKISVTGKP